MTVFSLVDAVNIPYILVEMLVTPLLSCGYCCGAGRSRRVWGV